MREPIAPPTLEEFAPHYGGYVAQIPVGTDPVLQLRAQCLELSFRNNPGFGAHGVWGGLVEGERHATPATARRAVPAVPGQHVPARHGTGC